MFWNRWNRFEHINCGSVEQIFEYLFWFWDIEHIKWYVDNPGEINSIISVFKLKLLINYIWYDVFDNRSVDEIVWRIKFEIFFENHFLKFKLKKKSNYHIFY